MDLVVEDLDIRFDVDDTDEIAVLVDVLDPFQLLPAEGISLAQGRVGLRGFVLVAGVDGEDVLCRGEETGAGDMRFCAKRSERFLGVAAGLEAQSGGAVVPEDFGRGLQLGDHEGREGENLIGDDGHRGQQHSSHGGSYDDGC